MAEAVPTLRRSHGASGKHAFKQRVCRECKCTFMVRGDNDRVFCSVGCRRTEAARKRMDVRPCSTTIAKCKCNECGARFDRSRLVPFCSERCRALGKGKVAAAKRPSKVCPECGVTFVPPYGRGHSRYCSNECSGRACKRTARVARKAKQRAVTVEAVNPIKVFERDGWACHLCGKATPRRLRGTYEARAPELDHIVPLSKGGEHSYRNTACACRECNLAKSGSELGQLRLFG